MFTIVNKSGSLLNISHHVRPFLRSVGSPFSAMPANMKSPNKSRDKRSSGNKSFRYKDSSTSQGKRSGNDPEHSQGRIFGANYSSDQMKRKPFRSKTSPQEEIRTEFKKYLSVGLKSQDWSTALLHVQQRLEYNVIDEGKSVNGKLIATILNIYSKAGEYERAYDLFLSIQNRRMGGIWLEKSMYYKHIKLTSYHYQIILDACASDSHNTSLYGSADAALAPPSAEKQPYKVAVEILQGMVNNGGNGMSRNVKLPTADIERYPRRGRPGKTPIPTAVHFTSTMLACMSAKKFDLAYDMFLLARTNAIVPDTILFNTALNCMIQMHTSRSRSRSPDDISSHMITADDISVFFSSMEPAVFKDAHSYGAMIKHCQKINDYPRALQYLNEANNRLLVNRGLVDIVAQLALRSKDVEKARELLLLSASLPTYIVPTSAMLPEPESSSDGALIGAGSIPAVANLDMTVNSSAANGNDTSSAHTMMGEETAAAHTLVDLSKTTTDISALRVDSQTYQKVVPAMLQHSSINPTTGTTTNKKLKAANLQTTTLRNSDLSRLHKNIHVATAIASSMGITGRPQLSSALSGNAETSQVGITGRPQLSSALSGNAETSQVSASDLELDLNASASSEVTSTAAQTAASVATNSKPTANSVSILNNDNQLIRRVTHNISGTTNAQMLNVAPVSSYTSLLYSYSLVPHDATGGIITGPPAAKRGKVATKPLNNGRHAMKTLEQMQKLGVPVSKSQLMNVMSALETDFVFTETIEEERTADAGAKRKTDVGSALETSTPRPLAQRNGSWVPTSTSKRIKELDAVYALGLASGAFKHLKLKNSDTGSGVATEVKKIGKVLTNKCDLRKLPRVAVLRSAALRHLLRTRLVAEYSEIVQKIEGSERLQRHNLPIVTSDFIFITGNAPAPSATGVALDLNEEVREVVNSIEPMGMLQIKEYSRTGTVGITKDSLKLWLDTVLAVKQFEESGALNVENNDAVSVDTLRLSESAAIAIKQA